jgi:hypothetical protein
MVPESSEKSHTAILPVPPNITLTGSLLTTRTLMTQSFHILIVTPRVVTFTSFSGKGHFVLGGGAEKKK